MSRKIGQPIGQKRLTNIAVVRYKKQGKRFEVACYKNKVLNWRNGIEKDLDEVLQTTTVFSNVSKGLLAKHEDLQDVFGTDDEERICKQILAEGELQVSDKERQLEQESLFRDVASVLSEKCVNPDTSRPYTITMLERALRDVHFSVDLNKAAKQQALEALPRLQEKFAIRRARMRLKIQVPAAAEKELTELIRLQHGEVETQARAAGQVSVVCLADPGCFRLLHKFVQQASEDQGRLEVISLAAIEDSHQPEASLAAPPAAVRRDEASAEPGPATAASSQRAAASGFTPAQPAQPAPQRRAAAAREAGAAAADILYERGPIADIPEPHALRRERFAELDSLQPGWQVELRGRTGQDTADAVFYSPEGQQVGAFVNARRAALRASKAS